MKTKLEIIDETVKYYSTDTSRRGIQKTKIGTNSCTYLTEDGKMCAVGRCMIKPTIDLEGAADDVLADSFHLLKPEYRIEDLNFWIDLQRLHDDCYFWNENGLTKEGLNQVKRLKEEYKDE
jgi:hypothetical protein